MKQELEIHFTNALFSLRHWKLTVEVMFYTNITLNFVHKWLDIFLQQHQLMLSVGMGIWNLNTLFKVVFPYGNSFPAFLGKFIYFSESQILRKISREIGKTINMETLLVQSEKMELQVILDCKTCWNTLERMIERFLKILNTITIVLWQLKLQSLMERGILWNCERYVKLLKTCSISSWSMK
jgi:hypothetical protein